MLICDLLNKNSISLYNCDGLQVNSKEFSLFNDKTFTLDELEELVSLIHQNNKKVILAIDRIIEEFELNKFYDYLSKVMSLPIDYYSFSDLSVINYVIDNKLNVKLIYDSKTMSTSFNDCSLYGDLFKRFGNESVVYPIISNELTLDDVVKNASATRCGFVLYGYHQIFYSRRLIFNSYINYKKMMSKEEVALKLTDKLLHLQEEFRSEFYPIYQSEFGTFVYNAKKFCAFKEVQELSGLEIYKINGQFINEDDLLKVVNIYNTLLRDGYSESLENELIDLDNNVTKGFLYQESFLLKEGEK